MANVNDIVLSKAFDNGMVCASEQACIVDEHLMMERNCSKHKVTSKEKKMLENFV